MSNANVERYGAPTPRLEIDTFFPYGTLSDTLQNSSALTPKEVSSFDIHDLQYL